MFWNGSDAGSIWKLLLSFLTPSILLHHLGSDTVFFLVSWKQMSKVTIAAAAQICVIVCKSGREFNRWILVFTRTISHSLYVSLTFVLSANIFPQLIPFSIRFGSAFVRFYLEHFRLWNETSILFNKIGLCERWI